MKTANLAKITSIALLSFFLFQSAKAQELTRKQTDSLQKTRARDVFFELGGPGLIFSANYDTRLSNQRDGLGLRLGAGFATGGGASLFSAPFQLNYLLGKHGKYFEIGAGATYINVNINSGNSSYEFGSYQFTGSKVAGTMTFGYRYQPIDGGFSFRASFNPILIGNTFVPYGGLSFGYAF
jgi:hypothetical protein